MRRQLIPRMGFRNRQQNPGQAMLKARKLWSLVLVFRKDLFLRREQQLETSCEEWPVGR